METKVHKRPTDKSLKTVKKSYKKLIKQENNSAFDSRHSLLCFSDYSRFTMSAVVIKTRIFFL